MPRDKYFCVRINLKLVYDGQFWKVELLIRSVKTGCLMNPKPQVVAVDEQMIPFWGHSPARQVIKTKPNPCGLKNFVIAAPDRLPLDFFFYQGKGNPTERFTHLDFDGKAVIKLLSSFPPGISVYPCGHRYVNTEHLLHLLHSERETTGTGTLKKARILKNTKLRSDTDLKKEGRGRLMRV